MIYGLGTDIVQVNRMKKWINTEGMVQRFFNSEELMENGSENARCQHYAARFAAKEAFSKALGTGITGFKLTDLYITKNEEGKPFLNVKDSAADVLKKRCGNCFLHVSLSHEKEYATAVVIIESEGEDGRKNS
ncbi:MAG: holo-ACP synthase [Treponema sp.]|nr:holo-ACP synthase [Treponema sp.]